MINYHSPFYSNEYSLSSLKIHKIHANVKHERNCPQEIDALRSHFKAMRYHSLNLLGKPAWILCFRVINAGIQASPWRPSTETSGVKSSSLYVSCYNANISVLSTKAFCNNRPNKFQGERGRRGECIYTLRLPQYIFYRSLSEKFCFQG